MSRQAGFVTPIDLFIILVVVPLLAAGAWYLFKAAYREHYHEPPLCLVRIEEIAKRLHEQTTQGGIKPEDRSAKGYAQLARAAGSAELVCPQTGVPYEIQGGPAKWQICCADPGNHLGTGLPKSCRSERGWRDNLFPGDQQTGKVPEKVSVATISPMGWRVVSDPGAIRIERVARWGRILLGIGMAFLLPYIGVFAASMMMGVKDSRDHKTLKSWIALPPAFAFAAACYVIFFGVLAGGVWLLLSSEQTTFTPQGMAITSCTYPFDEKRLTVEKRGILAIGTDEGTFVAYRDAEGRLRAWRMRTTNPQETRNLTDELKRLLGIRGPS